jgi:hypothetical protein
MRTASHERVRARPQKGLNLHAVMLPVFDTTS